MIAIVSLEPLILPCRTALAEPESTKISSFLPMTGVTLKVSGAGLAANGFSSARAAPLPAIDFLQTLHVRRSARSSDALHWSRPLVESLSVLGSVIVMLFAVVLLAGSFLTASVELRRTSAWTSCRPWSVKRWR